MARVAFCKLASKFAKLTPFFALNLSKILQEEIQIRVQLPDYPSKPAWGCDGSEFEMQVPLKLLVGTVRDRIAVSPLSTSQLVRIPVDHVGVPV